MSDREANLLGPERQVKGNFPVVGIGAAAGGLKAFEEFLSNMPSDSGMAFVFIPHLHPAHESILTVLLQRHTAMSVAEAEEGMEVQPDHVYIISPGWNMSILNCGFALTYELPMETTLGRPVDFFFRSLARDQGKNAICIILSGTGSDGALGARDIRGEGGLVLAQTPTDATYDGMPTSAIDTGIVNGILPAAKMPELLLLYAKLAFKYFPPHDSIQRIHTLIRSHTGYDFSLYKESLFVGRIQHRMMLNRIADLSDYVCILANDRSEIDLLFKELLIRATQFFRDRDAFEALKKEALPLITKGKSDDRIRVWVPGCSTGEEVYSLAIILHEYAQEAENSFRTKIFATDIDSSVIDIARTGIYPDNIITDISAERLRRYFIKKDDTYRVRAEIRDMVTFGVQNLAKDPPILHLDLISCRNLLIYFGPSLQKKILRSFHYALNPEGVVFLGTSENIGNETASFRAIDFNSKIFQARSETKW